MKYTTAALCLVSATFSLAAPTGTSTVSARGEQAFAGFAVPSIIKNHDVTTNLNTQDSKTSTVRNGKIETSTLYEIPIPQSAAGKTCTLVIHAGSGDSVLGEKALDLFRNSFTDLANLPSGNLRDTQLARVRFDDATGFFNFDMVGFANPAVESFPCPAGNTLHWETVAVGEFDINTIEQDFTVNGANVPNGLSVGWW
ncbi:uncharacterized protein F4812DRAFT_416525 [Daldinia caldariorum]|uniref:uncharacterized protein n=1 Tax=Daldinia caldariorum TaxID=326644 RepID=UPI0020079C64|nr:uncharacterized protein F4812DRAFT_416525 [Daldinia caldariorum]KAI1472080.1 hypothetical protein F4812DRAFT_416525 [Daldinia caldariorum]